MGNSDGIKVELQMRLLLMRDAVVGRDYRMHHR